MSTRDGLEPSPSPDSNTHTQPLPTDRASSGGPDATSAGSNAAQPPGPEESGSVPSASPANQPNDPDRAWPPTWGEPPASPQPPSWGQTSSEDPSPAARPTWGQSVSGPEGPVPSWGQPGSTSPAAETAWNQPPPARQDAGDGWDQGPPAATQDAGAGWSTDAGPADPTGQTQPGWGQGGGSYPTAPTWGERPADPGSSGRRPSRTLAAVVAGLVLLAGGYGISEALDRNSSSPTGAGIPTAAPAAPIASTPLRPGEEPVAEVAKALLPTVVEIRRGSSTGGSSSGGLGSGFVYDKNGYIMTAAHVVKGIDQVTVRFYDGTKLPGQVLRIDEVNDVGVVKVDRTGLAVAPLAIGQTLQVGQLAVAIGSPFGLEESVTAGIVSSTNRVLEDGREVIQTDAPINPGNSGGLLANRQGQVIGINSAIRASDGSSGNIGIGFAVPIDIAAKSAEAIVQNKPIRTTFLGVTMAPPATGQDGALVRELQSGSPAEQAGLRVGDLVVAIDGQAIEDFGQLGARIRAHKPGDKVTLKVVRNGNETTVTATLGERTAG
jgi:S1-C subfamily serine protease